MGCLVQPISFGAPGNSWQDRGIPCLTHHTDWNRAMDVNHSKRCYSNPLRKMRSSGARLPVTTIEKDCGPAGTL